MRRDERLHMKKRLVWTEPGPRDLLDGNQVEAATSVGATARAALIAKGDFPQPVNIASATARKRMTRWVRAKISAWVEARINRRDRELAVAREAERRDRAILETTSE
jgi:predicted DNA-binding transcriptional regulator AlpA